MTSTTCGAGRTQESSTRKVCHLVFAPLALEAIASAPLVFPADVRRLTGRDPASDDFAAWHAAQLRTLVELLAER